MEITPLYLQKGLLIWSESNIMLKTEFESIFKNKFQIAIIVSLLLISCYLTDTGIEKYEKVLKKKETFILSEKSKVQNYPSYDFYGGFGFRVRLEPSPLIILFSNDNILQSIESEINTKEIQKVYRIHKGRAIFEKGDHKDFSGIMFLLGSLYFLFMGHLCLRSESFVKIVDCKIKIIKLIVFRLLLLCSVFIFICFLNYFLVKLNGINFSPSETKLFITYCMYLLIYLSFFYALGLFIFTIFKSKKIVLLAVWFLLIYVVPEINNSYISKKSEDIPTTEALDQKKSETLMDFERATQSKVLKLVKEKNDFETIKQALKECALKYLKEGYVENKEKERAFNEKVSKTIDIYENICFIIPSTFYEFLTDQISSYEYYGYKSFIEYLSAIKDKFIKFYIHKRYESVDTAVEDFCKNQDNIFRAQAQMPKSFAKGTAFTLAYTFLFFIASFLVLKHRRNQKKETLKPTFIQDDGRMYYLLCQNEKYMNMIYHHYEKQPDTACIDKINGKDIDPGISLPKMTDYFCKLMGANKERTLEHLEKLGISNLQNEKRTPETIKKIYCAVSLAVECDTFVIKDFISRESRTFERKFLALLKYMMEQDTTIIYLGTEPLQTDSKLKNDPGKIDKYQDLKIDDPLAFILR